MRQANPWLVLTGLALGVQVAADHGGEGQGQGKAGRRVHQGVFNGGVFVLLGHCCTHLVTQTGRFVIDAGCGFVDLTLDIAGLAAGTAGDLVDHDVGVGQTEPLALGPGTGEGAELGLVRLNPHDAGLDGHISAGGADAGVG